MECSGVIKGKVSSRLAGNCRGLIGGRMWPEWSGARLVKRKWLTKLAGIQGVVWATVMSLESLIQAV